MESIFFFKVDMISFIYSGLCINIDSRCNIVLIILSSGRITWMVHVDLYYPHKENGSPSFSITHTNFSGIIDYIFVEKTVPVRGLHFFAVILTPSVYQGIGPKITALCML